MKKIICILLCLFLMSSQVLVFATENNSQGSASAHIYTFEELTGLSREDIDHISICNGVDGIFYSTTYDKIITDIYNTINTKSFVVDMSEDIRGGFGYKILFFDSKDTPYNMAYTYTIPHGIVIKEKDGLTYRTSNEEELKKVVEKAYGLIANDCTNWSADYIVQAKDLGFLDGVTDISYKEPITREKFCEIIYNMLDRTMDIEWKKVSPNPFTDTTNEKVISLCLEGIINGKGGRTFAPNDYLTREEAATIIVRVVNKFMPMPVHEVYFEYDDISEVSEWASNSIQVISNLGVMNGVGDNKFAPQYTYTTEQAIATVIRLYNNK